MDINFFQQIGTVLFNDFFIDPARPLSEQLGNLKEDMLQIDIKDRYTLDVGWIPSFDLDGAFKIFLIKDCDWDYPIYCGEAKSIQDLERQIRLAVQNAQ